ncbi:MAG: hypothetical protein WDN26_13335 [Chitinophagaceae bacterium]
MAYLIKMTNARRHGDQQIIKDALTRIKMAMVYWIRMINALLLPA